MKKFEDFFPDLKSTRNHAVLILEETFNRYYNELPSDQEREQFLSDFSKIIKTSKLENNSKFTLPLPIEIHKRYYIQDMFAEKQDSEIRNIMDEIETTGSPFAEGEEEALFHNTEVHQVTDDVPVDTSCRQIESSDNSSSGGQKEAVEPSVQTVGEDELLSDELVFAPVEQVEAASPQPPSELSLFNPALEQAAVANIGTEQKQECSEQQNERDDEKSESRDESKKEEAEERLAQEHKEREDKATQEKRESEEKNITENADIAKEEKKSGRTIIEEGHGLCLLDKVNAAQLGKNARLLQEQLDKETLI